MVVVDQPIAKVGGDATEELGSIGPDSGADLDCRSTRHDVLQGMDMVRDTSYTDDWQARSASYLVDAPHSHGSEGIPGEASVGVGQGRCGHLHIHCHASEGVHAKPRRSDHEGDTMDMKQFLAEAWEQHGADAEAVFDRLPKGAELAAQPSHLASLSALIVHVAGEHLGRWQDGLQLLDHLTRHASHDESSPEGKTVWRSMAILSHCAGDEEGQAAQAARGRSAASEASDEIRLLAVATSALAARGRSAEALVDFTRALELAAYGPGADDPAARSLAVSGNNLACTLEETKERSEEESSLMLAAAEAARKYWEIVGTWLEVERAEYRLAMTNSS